MAERRAQGLSPPRGQKGGGKGGSGGKGDGNFGGKGGKAGGKGAYSLDYPHIDSWSAPGTMNAAAASWPSGPGMQAQGSPALAQLSAAWSPQSQRVERFHRWLGAALRICFETRDLPVVDSLGFCLMAFRASVSRVTGYTPNLLMTGREARFPTDNIASMPLSLLAMGLK